MNEQNYASRKASKRMQDAEIVLETDVVWMLLPNTYVTLIDGSSPSQWRLISKDNPAYSVGVFKEYELIPAPSFAELWMELPECIPYDDTTWASWRCYKQGNLTRCSVTAYGKEFVNTNPADALAELLILVKGQNRERILNKLQDHADKLKW